MARQASLLMADEIYYNLYGKAILQGVYQGDIRIPTDPSFSHQFIFYFMAETDSTDPFRSLVAEVTLPGNPTVREVVGLIPPEVIKNASKEARAFYRHPLLVRTPTLRPGRIEAKMIHESGEIIVGAPSILLIPNPS